MNVFTLRDRVIEDYASYIASFHRVRDARIRERVAESLAAGHLWPPPLIQLNPAFEPGASIDELVGDGTLDAECARVFRNKQSLRDEGKPMRLYRHQTEAVRTARTGASYVLTTGTGSGKSLAYIVPIVDHVLRSGSGRGVQALVVYPLNALANSQLIELEKFLCFGYPDGKGPVRFRRYTGQEKDAERNQIIADPPDILLTNYVMLELMLTRPREASLIRAASGLKFLVVDELHTYRGRQGADVALLMRRARDRMGGADLQFVGTSATLAGPGTLAEQRRDVAEVASKIFGVPVLAENVLSESLRRLTPRFDPGDAGFVNRLRERVTNTESRPPSKFEDFVRDPLSAWIETTFGLDTEPGSGRLVRAKPRSLIGEAGAASDLARLLGIDADRARAGIEGALLAGYECQHSETGLPAFAFRLHQFISRGDTVYASPEPEDERHITLQGQQFVPGERRRVLLPLVFCRECGQEYYCVWLRPDVRSGQGCVEPRLLRERTGEDDEEAGFLFLGTTRPWPEDAAGAEDRLPDEWFEDHRGQRRLRRDRKGEIPRTLLVDPGGTESDKGLRVQFVKAPFRFCLHCGVSYGFRQTTDFGKLAELSSEGRSTATTILGISLLRHLRRDGTVQPFAQKLLSFTDNRQDASLQAGHFNDFVEISLLRHGLHKAVVSAGDRGLRHEELTERVFQALDLPSSHYAREPDLKFRALEETRRALREVLGYRVYRDQMRGWRITQPNLEQCGLLEIRYESLDELCRASDEWQGRHPALAQASPETRRTVSRVLLDFLRRELAIKVNYLDAQHGERIRQLSDQRLIAPWAIDEDETLEQATVLLPRSAGTHTSRSFVYLSPRGGFGQFLRRRGTFPGFARIDSQATAVVLTDLLETLRVAALVERVLEPEGEDGVAGYQLPAAAMVWCAGDGSRPLHDPLRVPTASVESAAPNPFFAGVYREAAADTIGYEAREHTAAVPDHERVDREERFRKGTLPVLFCSPTLELGIDIRELRVVNLRNVPPTPANYAQRSGRAGRSGQPALVVAYCSTGSSHDQYFFRRPARMVGGQVATPRLDVANEELVRAHVHAVWLAETGRFLGDSLRDILDVNGEEPSLALAPEVLSDFKSAEALERARTRARRLLGTIRAELEGSDWYTPDWLDRVLGRVIESFDRACERWRGLFRAASEQRKAQNRIIGDASRSADDMRKAKVLRGQAESQRELLLASKNIFQSDFYSYRYFASEGFLPGYSFPRLPLSAFIPGRRRATGRDEFLSRPRFIAISEFGPRAFVYHEGSRYVIDRVFLPVGIDESQQVPTREAKLCGNCGYLHPVTASTNQDLCERCGKELGLPLRKLFRLENVSTRRRDRITADEEERLRLGYEIKTGLRFARHDGTLAVRTAAVECDGRLLARLTYGHTANLWRINLGWRRRVRTEQLGFVLDAERGYWQKNQLIEDDDGPVEPLSRRLERVIPFVEDTRNSLLVEPAQSLSPTEMASLQAALKNAIQVCYQLEDSELAGEPLPDVDDRRVILFYEAAEGGAGVLRRLVDDPRALAEVAREALRLSHFDPCTGEDLRRAEGAVEDCEAACYDCLLSYTNQRDHKLLDRKAISGLLGELAGAAVRSSPVALGREEHLERLLRLAESELERRWLRSLAARGHRLPSAAQVLMESCKARPDFVYDDPPAGILAAVYIDGPYHEFPRRRERDVQQTTCLEDLGYTVIRFAQTDDWDAVLARCAHVFGPASSGLRFNR